MEGKSLRCTDLSTIYVLVLIISNFDFAVSVMVQPMSEKNENSETIPVNEPGTTPKPVNCTHLQMFDHTSVTSECKIPLSSNASVNLSSSGSSQSSEVENMNSHSYAGGQDVDELGKGNFSEKTKNREEAVEEKEETVKKSSSPKAFEIKQHNEGDHVLNDSSFFNISKKRNESTVATAVAAGICGVLAVSAYAGLLIWRRMSRVHYGNQEELINDDDLGDINDSDLHHFELKLLSRDGKVIET